MPHLFKYVPPDTGRKILESCTLRWSTPQLLNDPFDMQFAFQLRIDRRSVLTMAQNKLWQHYSGQLLNRPLNTLGHGIRLLRVTVPGMSREEFRKEFEGADEESINVLEKNIVRYSEEILSHFKNNKIFCISDLPDSIPMWAYYAKNHTGVVLRFTDETPDNPLTQARRVRYVEQMPSLFNDETLSDDLAGYNCMTPERIYDEIVWTKSIHWAHEREWRVSAGEGRSNASYEDMPFNSKELDGVIFGVRTSEAERWALTKLVRARYQHVELMQAKTKTDAYEMIIEKADY
jgi:hypothetical protein